MQIYLCFICLVLQLRLSSGNFFLFCSYFVVCTGSSNTHVNAIVSAIQKTVSKELKEKPFHTEGNDNAEWVLIDYINVVVHVFQKQIREYYNIEGLWGDAKATKIASNY